MSSVGTIHLAELDRERARRAFDDRQWLAIEVARPSAGRVRLGHSLLFMGGTAGRRRGPSMQSIAAATAAMPGPDRQPRGRNRAGPGHLIAPGFVDTPLSASLLRDDHEARRAGLRARSRSAAWSGQLTWPPSQSTS